MYKRILVTLDGSPLSEQVLPQVKRLIAGAETSITLLTLTLPVLSAARVALFLVSGTSKREALQRLLAHDDIPAARVQARKIVIIADEAAAP